MKRALSILLSFALVSASINLPGLCSAAGLPSARGFAPAPSLGTLTNFYSGPDPRMLVFIQDLHANYSVQKNIRDILMGYQRDGRLPKVVSVEGAEGPIDMSLLARVPDSDVRAHVADYFVRQGELTGAGAFAAQAGLSSILFGADKESYYRMHRQLYQKTYRSRKTLVRELQNLEPAIEELKAAQYSRPMIRLEAWQADFAAGKIDFSDYISRLRHEAASSGLAISKIEYPFLTNLSNDQFKDPAWQDSLDMELQHLNFSIRERLAPTPAAARLVQAETDLNLLRRLLNEKVGEREVHEAARSLPRFVATISALVHSPKVPAAALEEAIKGAIDFYTLAIVRDRPLLDHTLQQMNAAHSPVGILIAGGFHGAGVLAGLRSRGISYAVITPEVGAVGAAEDDLYARRLLGEHVVMRDVLTDHTLVAPSGSGRALEMTGWALEREPGMERIGLAAIVRAEHFKVAQEHFGWTLQQLADETRRRLQGHPQLKELEFSEEGYRLHGASEALVPPEALRRETSGILLDQGMLIRRDPVPFSQVVANPRNAEENFIRQAYQMAKPLLDRRFSAVFTEENLSKLDVQIVQGTGRLAALTHNNAGHWTLQLDNSFFDPSVHGSEILLTLELEEELTHFALSFDPRGPPASDLERGYVEVFTDIQKIEAFHELSVDEQAQVIQFFIKNDFADKAGFYQILLRSYVDENKYQQLRNKLFALSLRPAEVQALDNLRPRIDQPHLSIPELALRYAWQPGVYEEGIRQALSQNYLDLLRLYGEDASDIPLNRWDAQSLTPNEARLQRDIVRAMESSGRDFAQVVLGLIGEPRIVWSNQDLRQPGGARAPPSQQMLHEGVMFGMLSGGGFASGTLGVAFDRWVHTLPEKTFKAMGVALGTIVPAHDNGGNSRFWSDLIRISRRFVGTYVPAVGDLGGSIGWLLAEHLPRFGQEFGISEGDNIFAAAGAKADVFNTVARFRDDTGQHGVEVLLIKRLQTIQERITGHELHASKSWIYFVSNMLGVARLIDRQLGDDLKKAGGLDGSSIQNIAVIGGLLVSSALKPTDGTAEGLTLDEQADVMGYLSDLSSLRHNGALTMSTYKEAALIGILEGSVIRLDNDYYLIGKNNEGKWVVRPVQKGLTGGPAPTPLVGVESITLAKDSKISVLGEKTTNVTLLSDGTVEIERQGDGGIDVFHVRENPLGKEGDIQVKLDDNAEFKSAPFHGDWMYGDQTTPHLLPGGTVFDLSGARVEGQSPVTDVEHLSHVKKVLLTVQKPIQVQGYQKRIKQLKGGGEQLKEIEYEIGGQQVDVTPTLWYAVIINGARHLLFAAPADPFTSILPHLLSSEAARNIKARQDIPRVWIPKVMESIESGRMTLSDILQVYETSIQAMTADDTFRIEQLFSDIILPIIPKAVMEKYLEVLIAENQSFLTVAGQSRLSIARTIDEVAEILTSRNYQTENTQHRLDTKDLKTSKYLPGRPIFGVVPNDPKDRAFIEELRARGIKVHLVNGPGDFVIWENKIAYEPERLRDRLLEISAVGVQPGRFSRLIATPSERKGAVILSFHGGVIYPESPEFTDKLSNHPVSRENLIRLLSYGTPVAICTTASYYAVDFSLIQEIPAFLRRFITVYAEGAAVKITFNGRGEPIRDGETLRQHEIKDHRVQDIREKLMAVGTEWWNGLPAVGTTEFHNLSKSYPEIFSQEKNLKIRLLAVRDYLNSGEIDQARRYIQANKLLEMVPLDPQNDLELLLDTNPNSTLISLISEIEQKGIRRPIVLQRGGRGMSVVEISLLRFPSRLFLGTNLPETQLDEREKIIGRIRELFKGEGLSDYAVESGGLATINIVKSGTGMGAAVQDFFKSNPDISPELSVYIGGRFFNINQTTGEDMDVYNRMHDTGLQFAAVNPSRLSVPEIPLSNGTIQWISPGQPDATERVLHQLAKSEHDAYAQETAAVLKPLAGRPAGELQPITEWHRAMRALRIPMRRVTLLLDRGAKGTVRYEIGIPIGDIYDSLPDELKRVVQRYVYISLYNRFHTIGAEHVYIDAPADIFNYIHSELSPTAAKEFHPDRNPAGHPRSPADYFSDVYETPFTVEHKDFEEIESIQNAHAAAVNGAEKPIDLRGTYVGLDVGKSDVKAAFVYNGEVLASVEQEWNVAEGEPEKISDPQRHLEMLADLVRQAVEKGAEEARKKDSHFENHVDGIGLAWNGAVNNNRIRGRFAPVVKGLSKDDFENGIAPIAEKLQAEFGVPVSVLNDGDAGALLVAVDSHQTNVLAWSLGSGLASGYIDAQGNVTDYLTEMGNVVTNMDLDALRHSVTGMPGAIQRVLSQRYVLHHAHEMGIPLDLDANGEPAQTAKNLETVQTLYARGSPHQQALIRSIFIRLGGELATAIQDVHHYLPVRHVILFGRVMTGQPGDLIVQEAARVLQKDSPDLAKDVKIEKIDEELVRRGQAVGAAYYAAQTRPDSSDGTRSSEKSGNLYDASWIIGGIFAALALLPTVISIPLGILGFGILGYMAVQRQARSLSPKAREVVQELENLPTTVPEAISYKHGETLATVLSNAPQGAPSAAEIQSAEGRLSQAIVEAA